MGAWKSRYPAFRTRIEHLGALSLFALLVGGLLLILIAVNALAGPQTSQEGKSNEEGVNRFRYGSLWSLQAWTAITGVGFGLLAYGYSEAYTHLFDWWCSRQARTEDGLDYGRYLNTLSRAPVAYGVRGFPLFATLRHLLVLLSIAASIGYRFGLSEWSSILYKNLEPSLVDPILYDCSEGTLDVGSDMPWFKRSAAGDSDRGIFQHNMDWSDPKWYQKGPAEILMAGVPCGIQFSSKGNDKYKGRIVSREVVMVAQKKEEEGKFTMSRDDESWISAPTSQTKLRLFEEEAIATWAGIPMGDRVVIQYRSSDQGDIQIQWGRLGSWYTDLSSTASEPVVRRETYRIRYAVADAYRIFADSCASIMFGTSGDTGSPAPDNLPFDHQGELLLLCVDNSTTRFNKTDPNTDVKTAKSWINTLIQDEKTQGGQGVSVIVRAFMFARALADMQSNRTSLRLLSQDDQPFGPDNSTTRRLVEYPYMSYPFFIGERDEGVIGCDVAAAAIFVVMGCLAAVTMAVRIIAGPAEITSWTAQHLYLARAGVISMDETQCGLLVSGYRVAPAGLGRVKIEKVVSQEDAKSRELESLVSEDSLPR